MKLNLGCCFFHRWASYQSRKPTFNDKNYTHRMSAFCIGFKTCFWHGPQNQLCRAHRDSQRVKWQSKPAWVWTWSFAYILWLLVWCFCGTPVVGLGGISDILPAPGTLFIPLGCLSQPWYERLFLVLLQIVINVWFIPGRYALFWREKRRSDSEGWDLGGWSKEKLVLDVLKNKQTKNGTCSWTWLIKIEITNHNNIYKLGGTDEKRLKFTWGDYLHCTIFSSCYIGIL